MAQRHTLIDPTQPSTSKRLKTPPSTTWDICILCQVVTEDSLQCPFRSTKQPVGSGYQSLADDPLRFQALQHVPMNLNLERLDDGNGIASTLMANRAGWHKKCRLKYNKKAFEEQSRGELSAEQQQSSSAVKTRSVHSHPQYTEPICFFCNEPAGLTVLHEVSTYNIDTNVRRCALELEDTALLAKLAAGDMIAIEAKYHQNCLRSLYNKARQSATNDCDEDESRLHGIAFAELVAFMEDMNRDEETAPVFKLIDIGNMYNVRLEQLGMTVEKRIHTTRLKN